MPGVSIFVWTSFLVKTRRRAIASYQVREESGALIFNQPKVSNFVISRLFGGFDEVDIQVVQNVVSLASPQKQENYYRK